MKKFDYKKDKWMLAEDIPNCDLFFSQIWMYCFPRMFGKNTGRAYSKILCRYTGSHLWFYFGERDSFEVGENIVNRIINESGYAEKINKNIIIQANKLRKFCKTIPQKNLDKLSNKKLWQIYNQQDKIHKEYYTWCWIPAAVDMFHDNLSSRLKNYLRELCLPEYSVNDYFVTLTQPTKQSLVFKEQMDLLKIGDNAQMSYNGKILKPVQDDIKKHWRTYYYTKHLWVEGEYTIEDYIKQLQVILSNNESCGDIIKKQLQVLKLSAIKKRDLMKKMKMPIKWRKIFNAFGDFMVTKIYRRYAQIFAVYQMDSVLKEIARRFELTLEQVRFLLPSEVKKLLFENVCDNAELTLRTQECVYYIDKDEEKIVTGRFAQDLLKQIEQRADADITEFRGQVGYPGYGKGKVKIIIRAEDMKKMEKGDVLVSIATDPDVVPAMKKACAIVTDQGGVTSHAAIVAREFGIPCVIGTKIATRVLKDGDVVEVDANNGIVRRIN